jgi:hypothetical protein
MIRSQNRGVQQNKLARSSELGACERLFFSFPLHRCWLACEIPARFQEEEPTTNKIPAIALIFGAPKLLLSSFPNIVVGLCLKYRVRSQEGVPEP